ncbi:hypothetical protein NW983_09375 [Staphylococcus aureus]|nr:hypothetical protein [Staphylococcus aureus]UVJ20139.1 hypothetical protein NW983_09375 [Staphylococcus aureus]
MFDFSTILKRKFVTGWWRTHNIEKAVRDFLN